MLSMLYSVPYCVPYCVPYGPVSHTMSHCTGLPSWMCWKWIRKVTRHIFLALNLGSPWLALAYGIATASQVQSNCVPKCVPKCVQVNKTQFFDTLRLHSFRFRLLEVSLRISSSYGWPRQLCKRWSLRLRGLKRWMESQAEQIATKIHGSAETNPQWDFTHFTHTVMSRFSRGSKTIPRVFNCSIWNMRSSTSNFHFFFLHLPSSSFCSSF